MISKAAIEKAKALLNMGVSRTNALSSIKEEIKKELGSGRKKTDVVRELNEKIENLNLTKQAFQYWINKNLKNERKDTMGLIKTKTVALVNFKGGVGKSTIANLLDFNGSVVLNIDTQDAEEINFGERTINYFEFAEEMGIETVAQAIDMLQEDIDVIFLDTPGWLSKEFNEALPYIDYFAIVTNPNIRDASQTINTIIELANDNRIKDNAKFFIIFNKYVNESDLEKLKEIEDLAKEELGDRLIGSTALKYSSAIPTIEERKKSINELSQKNKVAYIKAKQWINKLKNDVRGMIHLYN